jgi:DNA-binding response OmpR family regulator
MGADRCTSRATVPLRIVEGRPCCAGPTLPAPRRVLLVEDEPSIAITLRDELEEHGFVVTDAANGDDAVALCASHDYEAVVTDLRLPGANGVAVLLAAKSRRPATPVLVISAHLVGWERAVLAAGADGILRKPFPNHAVVDWLRERPPRPPLPPPPTAPR